MELQETLNTIENNLMANTDMGFVMANGLTLSEAYDIYASQIAIHRAKHKAIRHLNTIRNR